MSLPVLDTTEGVELNHSIVGSLTRLSGRVKLQSVENSLPAVAIVIPPSTLGAVNSIG